MSHHLRSKLYQHPDNVSLVGASLTPDGRRGMGGNVSTPRSCIPAFRGDGLCNLSLFSCRQGHNVASAGG